MCGIVGFTGKSQASPFLLKGLESLEYRGYDSAGIAVISSGSLNIYKTVGRIGALKAQTDNGEKAAGYVGIGHTRWATHGMPTVENAHPHLSENSKFAVVHNGIIENYTDIRAELEGEGMSFSSQTDTEVIPMLLQKYYKGDLKAAISKTVERLKGSYALGILCIDFPDTLVAVRRFSPLIIGIADGDNIIASDVTAIVPLTKRVIYIEDGELAFITPNTVEIYDSNGGMVDRKITVIDWDIQATEKGGFDHFMMKEITEQPQAVYQTLESCIKENEIIFPNFKFDDRRLKSVDRIVITACGSAYHAGMVGKYVLEEMLRIPTEVDLASEFRYRNPVVDGKTLTVVISQSGETADTLAALREAKQKGSHTLAIVNVQGSSIAKEADDVIYTKAGLEIAVATTKAYSAQLAVIYLFALWAAEKLNTHSRKWLEVLLENLKMLPQLMGQVLENCRSIKETARLCQNTHSIFFIGRNIDYAVALEASLKLKEISYIHSQAYAAGELKHGTISLIEEGSSVIALCGGERLFEKLLSNIKEVRARGAKVIACATAENTAIEDAAETVIYIPKTHPLLMASLEVIPFQLYAYYVALYKGCDIDKPRNLAKSVTVE